ncbi:hypothetical protein HYR65_01205 [Candidatus Azambacteria bacterium]|nr:hypothetical protein [Candidatus Azambacteria bacterium]
MSTKTIVILILILVVFLGGWYLLNHNSSSNSNTSPAPVTSTTNTTGDTVQPSSSEVTVTYADSGFSPSTVTVKQGQIVTWVNQRSSPMWIASNPHPTHEGYSGTTKNQHCPDTAGTAFDECAAGTRYTFTFGKVGTWGYHNHMDSGMGGTVIVTP